MLSPPGERPSALPAELVGGLGGGVTGGAAPLALEAGPVGAAELVSLPARLVTYRTSKCDGSGDGSRRNDGRLLNTYYLRLGLRAVVTPAHAPLVLTGSVVPCRALPRPPPRPSRHRAPHWGLYLGGQHVPRRHKRCARLGAGGPVALYRPCRDHRSRPLQHMRLRLGPLSLSHSRPPRSAVLPCASAPP